MCPSQRNRREMWPTNVAQKPLEKEKCRGWLLHLAGACRKKDDTVAEPSFGANDDNKKSTNLTVTVGTTRQLLNQIEIGNFREQNKIINKNKVDSIFENREMHQPPYEPWCLGRRRGKMTRKESIRAWQFRQRPWSFPARRKIPTKRNFFWKKKQQQGSKTPNPWVLFFGHKNNHSHNPKGWEPPLVFIYYYFFLLAFFAPSNANQCRLIPQWGALIWFLSLLGFVFFWCQ